MKRWYVIQVFAGYEEVVKAHLERFIEDQKAEELFGDVLVPSAKVKQFFAVSGGKDENLFPGYMLVQMDDEPRAIRIVQQTPRVIRFLGGESPVPLSKDEVDRILSQMRGEIVVATESVDFSVGNEVEIQEGPFAGFVGIVDAVDKDSERLTVMVSIFGRMTPVELAFSQVKQ